MFSLRNKKNYLCIILNTPLIWSSGIFISLKSSLLKQKLSILFNIKLGIEGQCCFFSMSLHFVILTGAGYHLVVVKSKSCNVDQLTKMIQTYIPTANKESEISAEVSYLLPFNESAKFEKLFTDIEQNFSQLGITSFGVSATTMEEVFLK